MSTQQQRLQIAVRGRVQGVFFRASTQDQARRLLLSGWVRNQTDGSVEIAAEGDPDQLAQLLAWCRHGPSGARVDGVEHEWSDTLEGCVGFYVRY